MQSLLGDRVDDVEWFTDTLRVDRFGAAEEFRAFFKQNYGPTIAAYKNLADQSERAKELDNALDDLTRKHLTDGVMTWEYLVLTARRA